MGLFSTVDMDVFDTYSILFEKKEESIKKCLSLESLKFFGLQ